jgi:hypothetical protein
VIRGEDRARVLRLSEVRWTVPPPPRCDEEGEMEVDEDAPRGEINPVSLDREMVWGAVSLWGRCRGVGSRRGERNRDWVGFSPQEEREQVEV